MFSSSTHHRRCFGVIRTRNKGEIIKNLKKKDLIKKKKTIVTLYCGVVYTHTHTFCELVFNSNGTPFIIITNFCWFEFFCLYICARGALQFELCQIALYDRKSVIQRAIYGQLGTFTLQSTTRTFAVCVCVCFFFGCGTVIARIMRDDMHFCLSWFRGVMIIRFGICVLCQLNVFCNQLMCVGMRAHNVIITVIVLNS